MDLSTSFGFELPKDFLNIVKFMQQYAGREPNSKTNTSIMHKDRKIELQGLLPKSAEHILYQYQHDRRALTAENFCEVVQLQELLEFLHSRISVANPGRKTKVYFLNGKMVIICPELAENFAPKLNTNDRVKANFKEFSIMTKFIFYAAHEMTFKISAADYGKLSGAPTLISLANLMNDSRAYKAQRKIASLQKEVIRYLFPENQVKITPFKDRKNWIVHCKSNDEKQLRFVDALIYNHYSVPAIIQGVAF